MTHPDQDRVTCPDCGKGYRWKDTLVGRLVPCRKCGTEFTVPSKPGKGKAIDTSDDSQASVYALAMDIDDMPEPQPAAKPKPQPPETPRHEPPAPAVKTQDTPPDAPPSDAGDDDAEAPAHVSEAAKAKRREEQRKAAAEAAPARSWRDYKLLIILGGAVVLVAIAVWILIVVSDGLEGFLS